MPRYDAVCFGDLLVDFTPFGLSPSGMRLFEQNAGGAPANVAAALAKLGHTSAFIGKVGQDINGHFLAQALRDACVDTSALILASDAHTSMAFVALTPEGERDFSFLRDAETKIRADELDADMIANARLFHFGSLSMTCEPAYSATQKAIQLARNVGCIISYDPNYRAPLWADEASAVRRMGEVLPFVDILKVSEEEMLLLTGSSDIEAGGRELLSRGPSCVAVTQGAAGAAIVLPSGCVHTPAQNGPVADTTGAGDAFMGGFLSQCLTRKLRPEHLTLDDAREMSLFAHAVAACCVALRGGIPAMPTLEKVRKLL